MLLVTVEDLIAGLARDAGLAADLAHCLTVQKPDNKSKTLLHYRTLLPGHRHIPLGTLGGKCYPCVRYELSPMSRAVHRQVNDLAAFHFSGPVAKERKADCGHWVIERHVIGGQAGASSLIRKYLGFPTGAVASQRVTEARDGGFIAAGNRSLSGAASRGRNPRVGRMLCGWPTLVSISFHQLRPKLRVLRVPPMSSVKTCNSRRLLALPSISIGECQITWIGRSKRQDYCWRKF